VLSYGPVGPSSRLLSSPLLGLLSVARRIRLLARALRALVDVASRQTIGRSSSGSAATAGNNSAQSTTMRMLRCAVAALPLLLLLLRTRTSARAEQSASFIAANSSNALPLIAVGTSIERQRSISAASAQHQRSAVGACGASLIAAFGGPAAPSFSR
jgi:hypothetical protein